MLQTHRVRPLDQVRAFLDGAKPVEVQPLERSARYEFVAQTLGRFGYWQLGKADKGVVRRFAGKVSEWSRAQLTRLIAQHRSTGRIGDRRGHPGATLVRTSACSPRSMPCTGPCPGRPSASCANAHTPCSTTRALSDLRGSPTDTCTTFAVRSPTNAGAARPVRRIGRICRTRAPAGVRAPDYYHSSSEDPEVPAHGRHRISRNPVSRRRRRMPRPGRAIPETGCRGRRSGLGRSFARFRGRFAPCS